MSTLNNGLFVDWLLFVYLTTSQCQFHFTNYNVSFDLSPLTLSTNNAYQIAHSALSEYSFFINFCANTQTSSGSPCNSANSAYAYVRNNGHNAEYWCESAADSTPTASLIIKQDPSFGIILNYTGGSRSNGCIGTPRSMEIYLMCDANVTNIESTEIAYSYNICKYKITPIHTPYACPITCHSNQYGELCTNHGECGYDWNIGSSRCFCFNGWSGSLCNNQQTAANITSPIDVMAVDTSSKYVFGLYGGKVIYNLSYLAITATDHPRGRDFNQLLETTNKYYWSVFDYAIDKGGCGAGKIDNAYIYQADTEHSNCFNMGSMYDVWLYDPYNPVKGLTINYTNGAGDYCPYNGDRKRTFLMNLICADFNYAEDIDTIDIYGEVEEIDDCVYTMTTFDITVCPYQCLTYSSIDNTLSLCSTHGICAYDTFVGFVRCLCNNGYTGDYCQYTVTETNGPTLMPIYDPTKTPTTDPTKDPTKAPTIDPTKTPTKTPTIDPTKAPTIDPTSIPTINPTDDPSTDPTYRPTSSPSNDPTVAPTHNPVIGPISDPTKYPTKYPTLYPTTLTPTDHPTVNPIIQPKSRRFGVRIFIEVKIANNSSNKSDTDNILTNITQNVINEQMMKHNLTDCILSDNYTASSQIARIQHLFSMNSTIIVCDNKTQHILLEIGKLLEKELMLLIKNATIRIISDVLDKLRTSTETPIIAKVITTENSGDVEQIETTKTTQYKVDTNGLNENDDTIIWKILPFIGSFIIICIVLLCGIIFVKYRMENKTREKNVDKFVNETNMTEMRTAVTSLSSAYSGTNNVNVYGINNTFQSQPVLDSIQPIQPRSFLSVDSEKNNIPSPLHMMNTNDMIISEEMEYLENNNNNNEQQQQYHHNNIIGSFGEEDATITPIGTEQNEFNIRNNDNDNNNNDNDDDFEVIDEIITTKGNPINDDNLNLGIDEFVVNGEDYNNDDMIITTLR